MRRKGSAEGDGRMSVAENRRKEGKHMFLEWLPVAAKCCARYSLPLCSGIDCFPRAQ